MKGGQWENHMTALPLRLDWGPGSTVPSWEVSQRLNIPAAHHVAQQLSRDRARRQGAVRGLRRRGGCTQDSVGLPVLTVHGMLGQGQRLQWAEWEGWQDHEQKSRMHSCFLETLSDSAKGEGLWVRAREELSGSSVNYDSLGSQSAFPDFVQFWSSVLICWVCKIGYDNAHCTAII